MSRLALALLRLWALNHYTPVGQIPVTTFKTRQMYHVPAACYTHGPDPVNINYINIVWLVLFLVGRIGTCMLL